MTKTISVDLGPDSYEVRIGRGLLDTLGPTAGAIPDATSVVVISDSKVAELYGPAAMSSFGGQSLAPTLIDFPPGEQHKTLATYGQLMDALLEICPPIDRSAVVVALGGGVTGDLAGFVAATALRGLRWIQCPTTLLAAVDASVGGKTAVDHAAGKNMIGAFHQPSAVLIDVDTLKTLGEIEIRNGPAECVKHAVIRDEGLLGFIEQNAEAIRHCDPDVMTEFVARNVAIKATVVAADEREMDQRAHLNFGHTIGHAIEVFIGYEKIPHGQGVALGMIAACRMAVNRGIAEAGAEERIRNILEQLSLPVSWSGLDAQQIWRIMQHDKKVRGGRVRMILPSGLGKVEIYNDITEESVREALEAIGP
ncbi:MAG: 3-dehydroquinate synthase [Phycisphaerae bacterium]|nr:3-dehydroquinate synthase [Phycisphaerae bacterium]